MPQRAATGRLVNAAKSFIEDKAAVGRIAFTFCDLTKETGLSDIAARFQLLRLRDRVVRVAPRQPFFLIVHPEHRSLGCPPPLWWLDDYFKWLGRPYYLALQSAASVFGSNPQALQVTQVITDRPCRPINVGRIQVRCFVKRGIDRTPTQPLAQAMAPLRVSTPEATAFDLVRYADRIGGIERAAETIQPFLPQLRVRELKRVLEAEDTISVAQRLGFIFDAAGDKKLAQAVRGWLPTKLLAVPLSPLAGDRQGLPIVERWRIINNSRELKA
jgi:hypothetical protein